MGSSDHASQRCGSPDLEAEVVCIVITKVTWIWWVDRASVPGILMSELPGRYRGHLLPRRSSLFVSLSLFSEIHTITRSEYLCGNLTSSTDNYCTTPRSGPPLSGKGPSIQIQGPHTHFLY